MDKNEWSQPIGVFDTTQFPADKSEELEVLQAENKKLKEEQSLTEVHDFLKRFADEFHVWSYGKNGGGQGERFKSYQEADEYYRHLASGPCSHVTLEAHLTLKEKKLNQNPIKSPNPLADADESGKLLPGSGAESKHAKTLAEKLVSLEAENKRLREALQDIMADRPSEEHNGNRNDVIAWQMWRRARAALTHPTGGKDLAR